MLLGTVSQAGGIKAGRCVKLHHLANPLHVMPSPHPLDVPSLTAHLEAGGARVAVEEPGVADMVVKAGWGARGRSCPPRQTAGQRCQMSSSAVGTA